MCYFHFWLFFFERNLLLRFHQIAFSPTTGESVPFFSTWWPTFVSCLYSGYSTGVGWSLTENLICTSSILSDVEHFSSSLEKCLHRPSALPLLLSCRSPWYSLEITGCVMCKCLFTVHGCLSVSVVVSFTVHIAEVPLILLVSVAIVVASQKIHLCGWCPGITYVFFHVF